MKRRWLCWFGFHKYPVIWADEWTCERCGHVKQAVDAEWP